MPQKIPDELFVLGGVDEIIFEDEEVLFEIIQILNELNDSEFEFVMTNIERSKIKKVAK